MKYKHLKITNYRGVDSSEIEFKSRGLTLVQGPNEVGKTSLGEAIGRLGPSAASEAVLDGLAAMAYDPQAQGTGSEDIAVRGLWDLLPYYRQPKRT